MITEGHVYPLGKHLAASKRKQCCDQVGINLFPPIVRGPDMGAYKHSLFQLFKNVRPSTCTSMVV